MIVKQMFSKCLSNKSKGQLPVSFVVDGRAIDMENVF